MAERLNAPAWSCPFFLFRKERKCKLPKEKKGGAYSGDKKLASARTREFESRPPRLLKIKNFRVFMKFIIIRHGQTVWNTEDRQQGLLDSPLTEKGIGQSNEFARLLEGEGITEVYSSDLGRAVKTAEIVCGRLGLKPHITPMLREISFGKFDGMVKSEIPKKYPRLFAERENDKFNIAYPGGTSYADLVRQVKPLIEKLLKKKKGAVLIVGHEAINRVVTGLLLERKPEQILKTIQPNDCMYFIETGKPGIKPKARHVHAGKHGNGMLER